jgi:hypothetical protein
MCLRLLSTVATLPAGRPKNRSSIPGRSGQANSQIRSVSFRICTEGSFRAGKAAVSGADLSTPSSTYVMNVWGYTSTPLYVFMAWYLIKRRRSLPFYLHCVIHLLDI